MSRRRPPPAMIELPRHWTAEQALAVFEFVHAVREGLWALYGAQAQQAWVEQLLPDGPVPDFDPDDPF